MNNILLKVWSLAKGRKKTSIFCLILVAGSLFYFFKVSGGAKENNFALAEIGSIIQEVSVTGKVKSAQSVDLAFEKSGRVTYVGVKSGNSVSAGRVLVQLDSSELLAQEQREKANVAVAESRLNQILSVANNANGDASAVADSLSKAMKVSIDAMVDFTNIKYKYFQSNTGQSTTLAQQKEEVLHAIYGQNNLGRTGSWYFVALNSGLKLKVNQFQENPSEALAESLIPEVRGVLFMTKSTMSLLQSALAGELNASQEDANKIKTDIDALLTQISEVSNKKKSIASEVYDIEIVRSQLEQAKASLALIRAQIAKHRLTAPFSGVVANVDVKVGQIVSPNEIMVSLIGYAKFQVETQISEADISKVSLNDTAKISLDSYEGDHVFTAKVVYIDPAGRVVDGITVYKVTLEFDLKDDKILSGSTADVDILTDEKRNVLYIPSRNIISRDGKKYIKVVVEKDFSDIRFANLSAVVEKDNQNVFEIEIKTGLKGSDGRIEILSGLKEGDKIIKE